MKTTQAAAAILLAMLACATGCGVPEAEVSGIVTIDGERLNEGDIIFEETDNSITPAAGKIVAGTYTTKALPGSKIVRINASRPSALVDPHMGVATRESMIAEEYNVQSTLRAEIKPGKNEGVDFKVKSIPQQ
jgi:hypothetical protein